MFEYQEFILKCKEESELNALEAAHIMSPLRKIWPEQVFFIYLLNQTSPISTEST